MDSDRTSAHGIILIAHGSRDPLWRRPVEAIAQRVQLLAADAQVACAYLELSQPSLPACAKDMIAAGVESLTIVPMFLGVGKHAREDLPVLMAALQTDHPGVTFTLKAAVGEDERVLNLLAQIAATPTAPP